jgi:hypothetical protein
MSNAIYGLPNLGLIINMIPKIEDIMEQENFRRHYLFIKDYIGFTDESIKPFIIETYTLPFRFIEMVKQLEDEDDERDEHLKWVVHNDIEIFETIPAGSDVLKNFDHFRSEKYTNEFKISRVLEKPLFFRQSVCCVSVFVWINSVNPLEIYIFSEPILTLLNEPEVLFYPSTFNNKYSYKQIIGGLKKDLN